MLSSYVLLGNCEVVSWTLLGYSGYLIVLLCGFGFLVMWLLGCFIFQAKKD